MKHKDLVLPLHTWIVDTLTFTDVSLIAFESLGGEQEQALI